MGIEVGRSFAIIFLILLVVMSLAVLVTEESIETPSNQIILSETDFEGNWTSWWVVLELEGPPGVDPAIMSQVKVEHYDNYPIRPQDRWDLQAVVSVGVNSSASEAIDAMNLRREGFSAFAEVTTLDIGDEGFLYEIDDWFGYMFRVKNVIVDIALFEPVDPEPSSALVNELVALQLSKLERSV